MAKKISYEDGSSAPFQENQFAETLNMTGLSADLSKRVAAKATQWLAEQPSELVPTAALKAKQIEFVRDSIAALGRFSPLALGTRFFPEILPDITEIERKIRDAIAKPEDLILGPSKTGDRTNPDNPDDSSTVFKKWVHSCYNPDPDEKGTPGKHVGKSEEDAFNADCPKKSATYKLEVWDTAAEPPLVGKITVTWSYDCCNIYGFDISGVQPVGTWGEGHYIFIFPTRSIPEPDPVKIRVCHPCVPKCLKIRIRVVFIDVKSPYLAAPTVAIRKDITFYVTLCPGGINAKTESAFGKTIQADKDATGDVPFPYNQKDTWGAGPEQSTKKDPNPKGL